MVQEDKMRLPKTSIVIALGTILAASAAVYASPSEFDGRGNREMRAGETYEQRGQALVRDGEHLERIGQFRKGEAMERQGRDLIRKGERLERQGRDYRNWR
jgi:hypothetical protein